MGQTATIQQDDAREQAWQLANGIGNAIAAADTIDQLDATLERQRSAYERLKAAAPDLARTVYQIATWRREDIERGLTP